MMIAMKKHNSVYNTMKPERAIQHSLVQCPIEWLPEETAHLGLRELGQQTRRIWFPEDVNGEPHESNPDDGCGGAKYKLTTIHIYDGLTKVEQKAKNYEETVANWREALSLDRLKIMDKKSIWLRFQTKNDRLDEPCYNLMGLMWRNLFGTKIRFEEEQLW